MTSNQLKHDAAKLVELMNRLSFYAERDKDWADKPSSVLNRFLRTLPDSRYAHIWRDGEHRVAVERQGSDFLIQLLPDTVLFKLHNFQSDMQNTQILTLRKGPWLARFEQYVQSAGERQACDEAAESFRSIDF